MSFNVLVPPAERERERALARGDAEGEQVDAEGAVHVGSKRSPTSQPQPRAPVTPTVQRGGLPHSEFGAYFDGAQSFTQHMRCRIIYFSSNCITCFSRHWQGVVCLELCKGRRVLCKGRTRCALLRLVGHRLTVCLGRGWCNICVMQHTACCNIRRWCVIAKISLPCLAL